MTKRSGAKAREVHGRALMLVIQEVTARNAERATMDLSLRERMAIQRLGLEGDLPIAVLGQRLRVLPSSMTGVVDRLEEKGYLQRVPHPSDRRATVLTLASKGRTAFTREVDFYRSLANETLAPLGNELKRVVLDVLMALGRPGTSEEAA
jgi:DNA-binding MarR family transcriptional regulator